MLDTNLLYEEVDSLWPNKRNASDKNLEKEAIVSNVKTENDATLLKNKIEILVADLPPRRLPSLISAIGNIFKKTNTPQPVCTTIQNITPVQDDPIEKEFKLIYDVWPENEVRQNEKNAKAAFILAAKNRSLEDIKKACAKYIEDMQNPETSSPHMLGIKRFVTDDDIFDYWLQKADIPPLTDNPYFESVYALYPEYIGKNEAKDKGDSLSFYRRFVKEEDSIDFYCAVKAYLEERNIEIKERRSQENYNLEDDAKFTKKFLNFIRTWKQQKRGDAAAYLLEVPILNSLKKRNIPYDIVYPGEYFLGALKWLSKTFDAKDNELPVSAVDIVTKLIENICNYLTSGTNHDNIRIKTPVDYSIVSEVIAEVKGKIAKTN
jgi:hypothetical protein